MRTSSSGSAAAFAATSARRRVQQGAALGQVLLGAPGTATGSGPACAHGGEQGGRDELILDGAPLPAALDPDVAGAQPVAQREQGGASQVRRSAIFPRPAPRRARRTEESDRQAARPSAGRRWHRRRAASRRRAAWRPRPGRRGSGRHRGRSGRAGAAPARRGPRAPAGRPCPAAPGARPPRRCAPAGPSRPLGDRRFQGRRLPSLAAISAAPSWANRRTLSLIARALRSSASSSRASARRNMRPTARSNRATPSSVSRAWCRARWRRAWPAGGAATARAGAARVKRPPSRASWRSRSGWTPRRRSGSRPIAAQAGPS